MFNKNTSKITSKKATHKVLFVDDEINVVQGYQRMLRKHIDMEITCSGAEGLKLLETNGPYAVVVSDMRMPNMDGLEFLTKVKDCAPATIRVMLTGNSDQQTAVDAVNKGSIFRFLNKPCATDSIIAVVNEAINEYERNIAEAEQLDIALNDVENLSSQLSYQANYDVLTKLINRTGFYNKLNLLLQSSEDDFKDQCLCHLDIDQFRLINDHCGRVAGDELLRFVSTVIRSHLRKNDVLARLVGDEFGILLSHCNLDNALQVAKNISEVISKLPFIWNGEKHPISLSIGIVPVAGNTQGTEYLLSAADSACFIAKEKGRNLIHVAYHEDENLAKRSDELKWVGAINSALEDNRFCLAYQTIAPIKDSRHGDHYELLIRMKDKQGKILPPGLFLPIAEKYNLCEKIDRWVVREAFQWFSMHPQRLNELHLCSINLSGPSLGSSEIFDFVIEQFEKFQIPRSKICFEITETAAISNFSNAVTFITELKKTGCLFALDDFGSGLSSFAYLKNLPVDFLKIDGMFVKEIVNSPIDFAMVKGIHEIGHVMGLETIAEFVENDLILNKLKEIGIDYAQGYGIGKPCLIDY